MRQPSRILLIALGMGLLAASAGAQPQFELLDSAQWTFNKDCVARGDTVLAALTYGLQAWDLSDPGAPALIGDYYSDARKTIKIAWLGDVAALMTQDGWLQVIDAADLSAMTQLGSLAGFGINAEVALREDAGGLVAFVAGSAGVRSVDLSDMANPLVLDDLDPGGSPRAIVARGDLLYVLAGNSGLHTIDAADPGALALLDSDTADFNGSNLVDLHADGGLLAAAGRSDGFALFDIGTANDPVFASAVSPGNQVEGVRLAGDLLFVAADAQGLLVYDVSAPGAPALVGDDPDTWYVFEGLDIAGDRAYLNYWDGEGAGVQIFDLSDTAAPAFLGHTPAHDYCRYVDASDGLVYTATGHQGIYAHEPVANGDQVELVRRGRLPAQNAWNVLGMGTTVYAATASDGFVIGDFSDPDAPVVVNSLNPGIVRGLDVAGNVAYIGVFGSGPATVDLSEPLAIGFLDQITVGYETVGLEVRGDLMATADRDDGLNLWDVSDPAAITWLGNLPTSARALDVAFLGDSDTLFVAAGATRVVDISDPSFPVEIASFGASCQTVELGAQDLLFTAQGGAGVYAWDIANPAAPVELDRYDTSDQALAAAVLGDRVFVADYSGLVALSFSGGTAAPNTPAPRRLALAAHPNPFNPRTDLSFSLESEGRLVLDIFDVSGRLQRRLADARFGAGTHALSWDGRDDAGRALPSGVYFARLNVTSGGGAGSGRQKLVLLH